MVHQQRDSGTSDCEGDLHKTSPVASQEMLLAKPWQIWHQVCPVPDWEKRRRDILAPRLPESNNVGLDGASQAKPFPLKTFIFPRPDRKRVISSTLAGAMGKRRGQGGGSCARAAYFGRLLLARVWTCVYPRAANNEAPV